MGKIRPIAIHLPQFHPVKENDEWWGKGFTEWTNVTKAKPLFKSHYQPHLPADLGFYDLRLPEVREHQAKLAKDYGIYGFCYYHYWFNGKRILEKPVNEILSSGKPDFPYMLCWANENWTRVWNGSDKEILLGQQYSDEDDIEHINHLIPFFKDPRYIRIDQKPVIAIYRSTKLPSAKRTLELWRQEARKHGLELYICRFDSFGEEGRSLTEDVGFDSAIEFQPMGKLRRDFQLKVEHARFAGFVGALNRIRRRLYKSCPPQFKGFFYKPEYDGAVIDYNEYVDYYLSHGPVDYKRFPCVCPMWDNTARRKRDYFIFKNATPSKYRYWIEQVLTRFEPDSPEENFVFINAWNEWAEGNHLEPCQKWGTQYLEATKDAFSQYI